MKKCVLCRDRKKIFAIAIDNKRICAECWMSTMLEAEREALTLDELNEFVVECQKHDRMTEACWLLIRST